jgi:hypothetical protein
LSEDKSIISSADVSLGTQAAGKSNPRSFADPWNVLICSDLGFASREPEAVTAAQLLEFVQSHPVIVRGTVPFSSNGSDAPFFVEFRVSTLDGFSEKQVAANIPQIAFLSKALDALKDYRAGSVSKDALILALRAAGVASDFSQGAQASPPRPSAQKKAKVSRILGMLDAESNEPASAPVDALIEAIVGPSSEIDQARLSEIERKLEAERSAMTAAAMNAPFLMTAQASWVSLKRLAKTVGRTQEIRLSVYSSPMRELDEAFEQAMTKCSDAQIIPDIVLFDYRFGFTQADIDLLGSIARIADQCKSTAVASIAGDDALFGDISRLDTLRPVFEEQRFIPFKRLRREQSSRCLVFCGPDLQLQNMRDNDRPLQTCPSWFFVNAAVSALLSDAFPFELRWPNEFLADAMVDEPRFAVAVPEKLAREAGEQAGIMLFADHKGRLAHHHLWTAADEETVGPIYTHFGANLLVNRVMRLAGKSAGGLSEDALIEQLPGKLYRELKRYGIVKTPDTVEVGIDSGRRITIKISSDVILSDQPLSFEFSFPLS